MLLIEEDGCRSSNHFLFLYTIKIFFIDKYALSFELRVMSKMKAHYSLLMPQSLKK